MTGVDISAEFLSAARARGRVLNLTVTWLERNMTDIDWESEFDGAYCFGNAFGYLDDAGNTAFLHAVARSLKPGARFVLDYPTVMEARLPRFQQREWGQMSGIYMLEADEYDPVEGRTITE